MVEVFDWDPNRIKWIAIITFYFDEKKEAIFFSKGFVDLGFVKTCDEFVMYLAHRIQQRIPNPIMSGNI